MKTEMVYFYSLTKQVNCPSKPVHLSKAHRSTNIFYKCICHKSTNQVENTGVVTIACSFALHVRAQPGTQRTF